MKRNGFTLIEMLVVVVIIAILAGIVFRLFGAGNTAANRSETTRTLELVACALEEFRAEYGKYPPVARVPDKFPERHQPDYDPEWSKEVKNAKTYQPFQYEFPMDKGTDSNQMNLFNSLPRSDEVIVFRFGLMSYLTCRIKDRGLDSTNIKGIFNKSSNKKIVEDPSKSHWYCENANLNEYGVPEDSPREIRFAERVEPYLKDIKAGDWVIYPHDRYNTDYPHTNNSARVYDAWRNDLNYQSFPPYDSYLLWSNGPDGISGTADDIYAGKE